MLALPPFRAHSPREPDFLVNKEQIREDPMRTALASLLVILATGAAATTANKGPAGPPVPPGMTPPAAPAATATPCANPNALGISRTVEIDTTGGPAFGFEHYKAHDFLEVKEVVLTFDDGPQGYNRTETVLKELARHCTKATFFSIGKMALGLPEILREVAKAGHTIGTHTWSHIDARKLKTDKEAIEEIERGISAVHRAAGVPIAPFFRFPALHDTPATLEHLAKRNIAIFSTDIDSFDFMPQKPEKLVASILKKLEKHQKGILLMHDIQPRTVEAIGPLLDQLKAQGYRIVHMKPKDAVTTLAEYDAMIEKDVKGLPAAGTERPTSSVVRTVPSAP
jgi:peptidoglycan/xylan/chitin deacetylase (PgdA/CDA1 family)